MRAYRVTTDGACVTYMDQHCCTREEAHTEAKTGVPECYRDQVRIELIEFATDQKTLCELLSGEQPNVQVLRTWALTPRGGLKEVPNGD